VRGPHGFAQLWDTEFYELHSHPVNQETGKHPCRASFSGDGRYLAYGGSGRKFIQEIPLQVAPPTFITKLQHANLQQEAPHRRLAWTLVCSLQSFTSLLAHRSIIGRCYKAFCMVGGRWHPRGATRRSVRRLFLSDSCFFNALRLVMAITTRNLPSSLFICHRLILHQSAACEMSSSSLRYSAL
jgi:hypothetical protein